MSVIRVYAHVCPWCGRDVAEARKVGASFEVYCNTERAGCGAVGPLVSNEALAVAGWNAKVASRLRMQNITANARAMKAARRAKSQGCAA
jgi:uncharacterized protein CbrC (UPF0167 family)